jgi:preprotein translocase subunit SecD
MTRKPLLWKFVLILGVIAVAAGFSYPPGERINLGLDLRGGSHIVLRVDPESAVKFQLGRTVTYVGAQLDDAGIAYGSILPEGDASVEVRGVSADKATDARRLLDETVGSAANVADPWSVSEIGSGDWRLTMPAAVRTAYESRAIDNTLSILRRRIDGLGVSEPLIQKQVFEDRILVQLPGVQDVERVKNLLVEQASLEWKEVSYPPGVANPGRWLPPESREATEAMFSGVVPEDTELFAQPSPDGTTQLWWPLKRVATVSGTELRNAFRSNDEFGAPAVSFELEQDAGRRFENATTRNLGRKMAIVLDGMVVSAPVIQGRIRDQGIIQGSFTVTEAEDLALKLRSGTIETQVEIMEERTIGPSLGRDSIRAGLIAGITGFVGVMLFMVIYYRVSGINAVVALALNVLLVFGALGALPFLFSLAGGVRATLTLPGIAGLILTVGMAVDSNVLIFERIREELLLGKTVRSAVDQGFAKAFSTILDCNVTTLVAAFFLFFYGTGTPVQGFAVTLTIGLLASMFTAVFVSRQLFELALSRGGRPDSMSI